MNRFLFFAFYAAVFFSSCSKSSGPKPINGTGPVHGFDVYVLGQCGGSNNGAIGGYWKNGVFKALTSMDTSSTAKSMAISGQDIYVAGYYFPNKSTTKYIPAYWKNGTIYPMQDAATVNCVAVNGSDVYIGGGSFLTDNPIASTAATYWKNGVKHVISGDNDARVIAIYFKGNDVYMVGVSGNSLVYWINDILTNIVAVYQDDLYAGPGSYIDGSDIYLSGVIDGFYSSHGGYWKNGEITSLGPDNIKGAITSIKTLGADLYCAGYIGHPGTIFVDAYYWKNGVATKIEENACTTDLEIDDTDLFIGGYVTKSNLTEAVYWLNGKRIELTNPMGFASKALQITLVKHL